MTQLKQTMSKKVIKTPLGHFDAWEWNGVNESGIRPFGDRVLIFPDQAAAVTPGHIILPDDLRERLTLSAETGVLIAMGEDAWLWNSDRTRKYEGAKPKIGTRVIFERYAGSHHYIDDGRMFRLMDDKCVGGLYVADSALIADAPKRRPGNGRAQLAQVTKPPLVAAR